MAKLMDDKTKRLFLGHGHAIKIDAAQGSEKVRAAAIDASLGRQRRGLKAAIRENNEMLAGIRGGQEANRPLRLCQPLS